MLNKGYRYSKAQALANYYADVRNTANFMFGPKARTVTPRRPIAEGSQIAHVGPMRNSMADDAAIRNQQYERGMRNRAWQTLRRDPRMRNQALGALGGAALAGGAIGGAAGYYAGQEDEQY